MPYLMSDESKHLTEEKALEIAGALARLSEIKESNPSGLVIPGAAKLQQEAQDLIKYLSEAMLTHGPELMGAYFAMHREYKPLLQAFAPIFRRLLTPPPPVSKEQKP